MSLKCHDKLSQIIILPRFFRQNETTLDKGEPGVIRTKECGAAAPGMAYSSRRDYIGCIRCRRPKGRRCY